MEVVFMLGVTMISGTAAFIASEFKEDNELLKVIGFINFAGTLVLSFYLAIT